MKNTVYDNITSSIIAQLEQGTVPWVKPWACDIGMPTNGSTHKAYKGINVLLCWMASENRGFTSNYWLTRVQASKLGMTVKKDEFKKGTWLTMYKMITFKQERIDAKAENRLARETPMIKGFQAYNLEQFDDIHESLIAKPKEVLEFRIHDNSEALIASTNADIKHGGDRAYYTPAQDYIQLPEKEAFPILLITTVRPSMS
jgi:antirestriction protein ArdC